MGRPTHASLRAPRRSVGQDQGLPAGSRRPRRRHGSRQSPVRRCRHLPLSDRHSLARSAGALWPLEGHASALPAMVREWRICADFRDPGARCRQRVHDARRHHRARPPGECRRAKKDGEDQAIGRSRGGLTTKIHAVVDALGNPVALSLTPGQAADITQAGPLLEDLEPEALIADKGYDDDALVADLEQRGIEPVIPPRSRMADRSCMPSPVSRHSTRSSPFRDR